MKIFCLILLSFFQFSTFADTQFSQMINEDEILNLANQASIDTESTCLDEYLIRSKQLKKFLIWAPPVTVVGGPIAIYATGVTTAFILEQVGIGGWSALGYAIGSVMLTTIATVVTFVTLETVKSIEYFNNKNLMI